MRRSFTGLRVVPMRAQSQRRWWHSFWLWLTVALTLAVLILWGHSAAAQTERGSEIIDRALTLQPDNEDGAAMYKQLCASCHGKNAVGDPKTVTPALAGQLQHYLIKQLVDFAEGDRTAPEMHRLVATKRLTTPQAMRNLASYLSGLPSNNKPQLGDGKQLARGKRVYEVSCAECHGTNGEGDELDGVPTLHGQHYSYLLMQMRSLAVGHRYSVDVDVIADLEALSFDELTAVADYTSRLPTQPAESIAALQSNP